MILLNQTMYEYYQILSYQIIDMKILSRVLVIFLINNEIIAFLTKTTFFLYSKGCVFCSMKNATK